MCDTRQQQGAGDLDPRPFARFILKPLSCGVAVFAVLEDEARPLRPVVFDPQDIGEIHRARREQRFPPAPVYSGGPSQVNLPVPNRGPLVPQKWPHDPIGEARQSRVTLGRRADEKAMHLHTCQHVERGGHQDEQGNAPPEQPRRPAAPASIEGQGDQRQRRQHQRGMKIQHVTVGPHAGHPDHDAVHDEGQRGQHQRSTPYPGVGTTSPQRNPAGRPQCHPENQGPQPLAMHVFAADVVGRLGTLVRRRDEREIPI